MTSRSVELSANSVAPVLLTLPTNRQLAPFPVAARYFTPLRRVWADVEMRIEDGEKDALLFDTYT